MKRNALWWGVLAIGIALIAAPLAFGLPGRSAAGTRMMNDFRPLMGHVQVQQTASYYYDVFVPLGKITPMFTQQNADTFQGYLNGLQSSGVALPPAAKGDFARLLGTMQAAVPIAARVPAGLQHYQPLVTAMEGNVDDFAQLDGLPSFQLFTWFFVVPGILLVLLAGGGLWNAGALHVRVQRPHAV